jgi:hypothetical protein
VSLISKSINSQTTETPRTFTLNSSGSNSSASRSSDPSKDIKNTNSTSKSKLGSKSKTGSNDDLEELKRLAKELEEEVARKEELYRNIGKSNPNDRRLADYEKERKRLTEDYNNIKNEIRRYTSSNSGPGINGSWGNGLGKYNSGYSRGEEFEREKAENKIDDGSEPFDPETPVDNKKAVASSASSEDGEEGSLSKGGSSSGKGSASGPGSGFKKRKPASYGEEDIGIVAKCGSGPVLKCIFPNSYFRDDEIQGRLYVTIANLRLEGRKFYGLEKTRKSKKDMKVGEDNKAKYFLITYDLILTDSNRVVTNEERDQIYREIKNNRRSPAFKRKLLEYRYMTKVTSPKRILTEKEALEAIQKTITKEEYEEFELLQD